MPAGARRVPAFSRSLGSVPRAVPCSRTPGAPRESPSRWEVAGGWRPLPCGRQACANSGGGGSSPLPSPPPPPAAAHRPFLDCSARSAAAAAAGEPGSLAPAASLPPAHRQHPHAIRTLSHSHTLTRARTHTLSPPAPLARLLARLAFGSSQPPPPTPSCRPPARAGPGSQREGPGGRGEAAWQRSDSPRRPPPEAHVAGGFPTAVVPSWDGRSKGWAAAAAAVAVAEAAAAPAHCCCRRRLCLCSMRGARQVDAPRSARSLRHRCSRRTRWRQSCRARAPKLRSSTAARRLPGQRSSHRAARPLARSPAHPRRHCLACRLCAAAPGARSARGGCGCPRD